MRAILLTAMTLAVPLSELAALAEGEQAATVPALTAPSGSALVQPSKPSKITPVILVDKKANSLQVIDYDGKAYRVVKIYHATLGQVKGDKQVEGDLKTPEGIYILKSKKVPPALKPKFGIMAFEFNFPNAYDQIAGRTGSDIMLHATNEPDRLAKNYDSLGCVVVRNEELKEIAARIHLGLTPILVFDGLAPEYMKPGEDTRLSGFFKKWVTAWEQKSIDEYMGSYHSDFSSQGKDKDAWKSYKSVLNKKYASIEVNPEDVFIYRHPKYSMITFTQNYRSKLKGGGWGLRSRGTKILYVAEEHDQPKIIAETFTQLMW